MTVKKSIDAYIASQPEPKRSDMLALHRLIPKLIPRGKLWFLDGKDSDGKAATNPNVGYGSCELTYADGNTREFYNVGISANATGVSVYIMGIKDRKYLPRTYAGKIGKASVTGYCIRFKTLSDINLDVLAAAIQDGVAAASKG